MNDAILVELLARVNPCTIVVDGSIVLLDAEKEMGDNPSELLLFPNGIRQEIFLGEDDELTAN